MAHSTSDDTLVLDLVQRLLVLPGATAHLRGSYREISFVLLQSAKTIPFAHRAPASLWHPASACAARMPTRGGARGLDTRWKELTPSLSYVVSISSAAQAARAALFRHQDIHLIVCAFGEALESGADAPALDLCSPPMRSDEADVGEEWSLSAAALIYLMSRLYGYLLPQKKLFNVASTMVHDLLIGSELREETVLQGGERAAHAVSENILLASRQKPAARGVSLTIHGTDVLFHLSTAPRISFWQFKAMMIELADTWTKTSRAEEHAAFLADVFSHVFGTHGVRALRFSHGSRARQLDTPLRGFGESVGRLEAARGSVNTSPADLRFSKGRWSERADGAFYGASRSPSGVTSSLVKSGDAAALRLPTKRELPASRRSAPRSRRQTNFTVADNNDDDTRRRETLSTASLDASRLNFLADESAPWRPLEFVSLQRFKARQTVSVPSSPHRGTTATAVKEVGAPPFLPTPSKRSSLVSVAASDASKESKKRGRFLRRLRSREAASFGGKGGHA